MSGQMLAAVWDSYPPEASPEEFLLAQFLADQSGMEGYVTIAFDERAERRTRQTVDEMRQNLDAMLKRGWLVETGEKATNGRTQYRIPVEVEV